MAVAGCTAGPEATAGSASSRHHHASPLVGSLTSWRIRTSARADIEGYASATSVAPGDALTVYVSTTAPSFAIRVFRMGWYGGRDGILVRSLVRLPGVHQPPAVVSPRRNTAVADWRPSAALDTRGLAPGDYLLRLDASDGGRSFIPLAVRGASARGTVVLVSPVTTWQAYNRWGCCDLYAGAEGTPASRARAVSFDRPYLADRGASEFLTRTLPVVAEAERLRLPLDYVTDVDLDENPHLLDGARAVISMGHDEYWSPAMRSAVVRARDAGANIAFLGANAVYRRIRFEASALGRDRVIVDYKSAAEDPLLTVDPAAVTSDWQDPPDPQPPSTLTGEAYGCFTHARLPAVVVDPHSPFFAGTEVTAGTSLPGLVGEETDRVMPGTVQPGPVEILMHSPFPCPQGWSSYADTTYYTVPSGAGVFDSGTQSWVCALAASCADRRTAAVVRRITDNLLLLFARGPAAAAAPVHPNAASVYARSGA